MYFIQIRYSDNVATNNIELRMSNHVIMEWNGMEWNGMEWNGIECILLRINMSISITPKHT